MPPRRKSASEAAKAERQLKKAAARKAKKKPTTAFKKAVSGRPLPDDASILTRVIADVTNGPGLVPVYVLGTYHDEKGELVAIECVREHRKGRRTYASHLSFSSVPASPRKNINIETAHVYYVPNLSGCISRNFINTLDPKYFPDLILRRAVAIVHSLALPYQHAKHHKMEQDLMRTGIVFNELRKQDIAVPARPVPELVLADGSLPFIQQPFTGYISQGDIERIFRIAKHYVDHCMERRLPIILPEPGQWPNWPPEFMQFEVRKARYKRLPWIGRDEYSQEHGFSCDPKAYRGGPDPFREPEWILEN